MFYVFQINISLVPWSRLGYEEKALQAKEAILKMVQELDDFIKQDLSIDHRIHSRLIGRRGRNIRQVMNLSGLHPVRTIPNNE